MKEIEDSHQIRRCLICGERTGKSALFRVVVEQDKLMLDLLQKKQSRGAYVHRDCLDPLKIKLWGKATAPGLWERALRGAREKKETVKFTKEDLIVVLEEIIKATKER